MPAPVPTASQAPSASGGVAWGGQAGADTTTSGDKKPKPLRWRGTTLSWDQAATTTAVGVGRDNFGSEAETYTWDFTLAPNLYLYDGKSDKVRTFATIGMGVELTNSDSTTERRELLLNDAALGLGYAHTFTEGSGANKGEYKTSVGTTGRLIFPTSKASYNQGRYLSTSLGVTVSQTIKLLGSKADGLNNVTIGVLGTWGHLFSRATQPTANEALNVRRQDARGNTITDETRLSSFGFSRNQLTIGGTLGLPLYGDLSLSTGLRLTGRFKDKFEGSDCDVTVMGSTCLPESSVQHVANPVTYRPTTSFSVSLDYPLYDVVDVSIGYDNSTDQLGEDGQRRDVLYSPDAQFTFSLGLNLDAVYSKATKRDQAAATASPGTKVASAKQ